MLYLLAVVFPFLALFGAKKPGQGILALILQLTILGWLPATIWAIMVVNQSKAEKRQRDLIAANERAMQAQTAALIAAQQPVATEPIPLPETPSTLN